MIRVKICSKTDQTPILCKIPEHYQYIGKQNYRTENFR